MASPQCISGSTSYLLHPGPLSCTETVPLETKADLTPSGYHNATDNDLDKYLPGVLVWYETKPVS